MKNYFSNKVYIIIKKELNNMSKIVKYYYTAISIIIFPFQTKEFQENFQTTDFRL